ncbi:dihydrolipoyl dehydrogenase [uncultured Duncaniella sp.]|uniref:dihydrolipoyl dehydrogenase n=1 Tax=uncultured Duncaniella sp. TaxID=2768039 RepID=UPI00267541E5|nr:dihydrolipoyl dehydrogenase [uncultured Duncaniella sp.]
MDADLLIIGAGPGGYETALLAAERGKKVILVNGGQLGGTCLNAGCIPTKCMVKDAAVVSMCREHGEFGVSDVRFEVDFNRVIARRAAVVGQLREGIAGLLKKAGVTVVEGKAVFRNANTVAVGEEEFSARDIIIATGSESKSLPVPGADAEWVLDSTGILNLEYIPAHLVIVGGGVIGLEFASVFRAFGSEVTVIEFMKNIAPTFDSDISKRLKQALSKRGVKIITGAAVKRLEQNDEYQLVTTYELKGKEESVVSTDVMMAVGRRPNVDGLGLEAAGVDYSSRGIPIDDNMRTNVEHIYAIGDVNARLMLAHVASFQGQRALNVIDGKSDSIRFDVVPAALFTDPECAMVGLTDEQCKEKGIPVKTGKSFFRANGKALAGGESDGLCKLLFDAETEELLGAHIMGAEAALLAQQCCDFITARRTLTDIKETIFGHPTLSEVILAAAHSVG